MPMPQGWPGACECPVFVSYRDSGQAQLAGGLRALALHDHGAR
jgi:hypothetical protein